MEKLMDLSQGALDNGITSHGILKVPGGEINLAYVNKNGDGDVSLIEEAQDKFNFWACYKNGPKPVYIEDDIILVESA